MLPVWQQQADSVWEVVLEDSLQQIQNCESGSLQRISCYLKYHPGKDTISNRSSRWKVYTGTMPGLVHAQKMSRRYKTLATKHVPGEKELGEREFMMGQRPTLCTSGFIDFYNVHILLLSNKTDLR